MVIDDKTFVVTGAGGGIGGALVRLLLAKGACVAAVDFNKDSLTALADELSQYEKRFSTHQCDISDKTFVDALPKHVQKAHGHIDVVINCAGVIQPFVTVDELDSAAIERVMNINFYGTLYMTKAFLPYLKKRPEAYLVNYSSMGGFLPVPGQSVYGASKAAVKLLTEGLYAELLGSNVRVSVVFPGATKTDIAQNSGVTIAGVDADSVKTPMLSAEKSAALVIQGIEKNKPRIFTGTDSKTMDMLYRIAPVSAVKMITKKMQDLLG